MSVCHNFCQKWCLNHSFFRPCGIEKIIQNNVILSVPLPPLLNCKFTPGVLSKGNLGEGGWKFSIFILRNSLNIGTSSFSNLQSSSDNSDKSLSWGDSLITTFPLHFPNQSQTFREAKNVK